jgi:hypothetical protein
MTLPPAASPTVCSFVAMDMCLQCRCLAMAASICATIPAFSHYVTICQSVQCLFLLVRWVTGEQSQIEQSHHTLKL